MSVVGDVRRAIGFERVGSNAVEIIGGGGSQDSKTRTLGAGSSTNKSINDTANSRFLNFNFDCGAASGDNRGMYLRLWLTGGAGGEALRVFTTMDASAGTAHGAHISLNFALTKVLSGQGVAMRSTLHVPNDATPTGTLAACQGEIYCDGNSADISGTTAHGLFRGVVAGGNSTAQNLVKYLFTLSIPTGSGNMRETGITAATINAATTEAIRIWVEGVGLRFIPVATAIA